MEESLQEIEDRLNDFIAAGKTGERIVDMPFAEIVDGYVYDDGLMRIAVSDDDRHLEVFRKKSGTIVAELSSGVIRRYSISDVDCLVPHLLSLLGK